MFHHHSLYVNLSAWYILPQIWVVFSDSTGGKKISFHYTVSQRIYYLLPKVYISVNFSLGEGLKYYFGFMFGWSLRRWPWYMWKQTRSPIWCMMGSKINYSIIYDVNNHPSIFVKMHVTIFLLIYMYHVNQRCINLRTYI